MQLTNAERLVKAAAVGSWKGPHRPLLTDPDGNHKISKNDRDTWSLNLAPADSVQDKSFWNQSGRFTLCPRSTSECRATCLAYAGRNQASNAIDARNWRTQMLMTAPGTFRIKLHGELDAVNRRKGAVRLNALSDLAWESIWPELFTDFPDIQYYDYTKRWKRNKLPSNYDLTYSIGDWSKLCLHSPDAPVRIVGVARPDHWIWGTGGSVTVPDSMSGWRIRPIIDGDVHDYRPSDPIDALVLLRPKGAAKKLTPGRFVL